MEKSDKQIRISNRRKSVEHRYKEAVENKTSITKLVNNLASVWDVTPITIYADIKKINNA